MALITLPVPAVSGAVIRAADTNNDFNTFYNDYNGNITNANIASSAGIVASKLNLATIAQTVAFSGAAENWAKGADIASATTTDIGAATGTVVDVTGTTTITGLGTVQAGTVRFVRFTGVLILTYNSSTLILPTSANITTAAGDTAIFESLGSGNWVCLSYQRRSGAALNSGALLQSVVTQSGVFRTSLVTHPAEDNNPFTTSSGDPFSDYDTAITPSSTSNRLEISGIIFCNSSAGNDGIAMGLFQDGGTTAKAVFVGGGGSTGNYNSIPFFYSMTAGTVSSTTFKLFGGSATGTLSLNGRNGAAKYATLINSSMTVREFKA